MKYLLIALIALLASSCGEPGGASDQSSHVTTATPAGWSPFPTSSPLVVPRSPTTTASPVAPEHLADALPSVDIVEDVLGIGVTDREVRNDLSQAFEGADVSVITDGVVGLYRGTGTDAYAIIDIAQFEDVAAAEAFFMPIHDDDGGGRGERQEIDVAGVGDEARGFVGTVEDEPGAMIGILYVRVEDVVSIILVRQPEEDGLADAMGRLGEVVAVGIDGVEE